MHKGKGQYTWKKSGALYDGDWKEDKRNGFGTYSVIREGSLVKEYAGGWKNDMRHVRLLACPPMDLRKNRSFSTGLWHTLLQCRRVL